MHRQPSVDMLKVAVNTENGEISSQGTLLYWDLIENVIDWTLRNEHTLQLVLETIHYLSSA